jgi:hypothetical protein
MTGSQVKIDAGDGAGHQVTWTGLLRLTRARGRRASRLGMVLAMVLQASTFHRLPVLVLSRRLVIDRLDLISLPSQPPDDSDSGTIPPYPPRGLCRRLMRAHRRRASRDRPNSHVLGTTKALDGPGWSRSVCKRRVPSRFQSRSTSRRSSPSAPRWISSTAVICRWARKLAEGRSVAKTTQRLSNQPGPIGFSPPRRLASSKKTGGASPDSPADFSRWAPCTNAESKGVTGTTSGATSYSAPRGSDRR